MGYRARLPTWRCGTVCVGGGGDCCWVWVKCCKRSCEGQEGRESGPNNHTHVGSRSRPPRFLMTRNS